MLRRCISLLVIMGLFASQLASVHHAHAGISAEEQQKHDATPHFHCSWPGHDHHVHGHSHAGHNHHRDRPSEPAKKSPLPEGLDNHDSTAVYCAGNAMATCVGQQDSHLSLLSGLGTLALWQPLAGMELSGGSLAQERPPDKVLDGSKIYLTLRNLRL